MTEKEKRHWFYQSIRIAVAGSTVSEPVHELLACVGRDEAIRRIQAVLDWHEKGMPAEGPRAFVNYDQAETSD